MSNLFRFIGRSRNFHKFSQIYTNQHKLTQIYTNKFTQISTNFKNLRKFPQISTKISKVPKSTKIQNLGPQSIYYLCCRDNHLEGLHQGLSFLDLRCQREIQLLTDTFWNHLTLLNIFSSQSTSELYFDISILWLFLRKYLGHFFHFLTLFVIFEQFVELCSRFLFLLPAVNFLVSLTLGF